MFFIDFFLFRNKYLTVIAEKMKFFIIKVAIEFKFVSVIIILNYYKSFDILTKNNTLQKKLTFSTVKLLNKVNFSFILFFCLRGVVLHVTGNKTRSCQV